MKQNNLLTKALLLLAMIVGSVNASWGGTEYELINHSTGALTGNFICNPTSPSSDDQTFEGKTFHYYMKTTGNMASWSAKNSEGYTIDYDIKTDDVTFTLYLGQVDQSTAHSVYYAVFDEKATAHSGPDVALTAIGDAMAKGSYVKRTIRVQRGTNARVCFATGKSTLRFYQIIAEENGDPVLQPGEIGYTLNMNKGRFANNGSKYAIIDNNIEIYAYNSYTMGNVANIQITKNAPTTSYIQFTTPASNVGALKLTYSSGEMSFNTSKSASGATKIVSDKTYKLTASTTYYLFSTSTSSNSNVTNLTFVGLPPTYVSSTPAKGATGVAVDATLDVTYDKNITIEDASAITLVDSEDNPIAIETPTASTTTLTVTPSADLTAGETYTLTIGAGALSDGTTVTTAADVITFTTIDSASPVITTDLDDENVYDGSIDTPLNLTIAAEHYTGFQWYSNTTATATVDAEHEIDGATSATYAFTPTTVGTKYFYCVVTNSNASGTKTAISKIATVTTTASSDASAKTVSVVANGLYTASASGTTYSATIGGTTSATVTITPNHEKAIVASGSTVGAKGEAIEVAATAGTPLEFTITAEDGTTSVDYILNITKVDNKEAADNAYYLTASEAIYGGQQIVGDDISMEFSKETTSYWRSAVTNDKISGIDANYVASTEGNSVNGCSYTFTAAVAGTLEVGVICNGSKTLTINNATSFDYDGVDEANGSAAVSGSVTGNTLAVPSGKKYDMIVTTPVVAGTEYKFYAAGGSKLGFFGFKFTPETIAVTKLADRNYGTTVTPAGKKLNFAAVSDMKAYMVTGLNAGKTALVIEKLDVVPAATPILLYTADKSTTSVNIPVTSNDADDVASSQLVAGDGTTDVTSDAENTYFYIAGDLFHKATSGTLTSGKAYLKLSNALLSHESVFGFEEENGDVTGISNVNGEPKGMLNGNFYNLSGQKVANPTKGLYIVNGKKVIVK